MAPNSLREDFDDDDDEEACLFRVCLGCKFMVEEMDFEEVSKRSLLKGIEDVTLDEFMGFVLGLTSRRKMKKRVRKRTKEWDLA